MTSDNPSPRSSTPQLLPELLKRAAADRPESLALATVDNSVSYRELLERASDLAESLRSTGAVEGTGVGIWLRNGVDWITVEQRIMFRQNFSTRCVLERMSLAPFWQGAT